MGRPGKVKEYLAKKGLDALIVDSKENCFYLTAFTGTTAKVLITKDKDYFLSDFRYIEQVKQEVKGFELITIKEKFAEKLRELIKENNLKNIAFEPKAVSYQQYQEYKAVLKEENLIACKNLIENLRMIKEKSEIEKIKKAVTITDKAFNHILKYIKVGIREKDIALELEYYMKKLGASKNSFDFVVASGARTALPHGLASDKKLAKGDFVILDFGTVYQGYCSDMTRTIVLTKADKKQKEIYNLVLKAQQEVIDKVKENMSCKQVDSLGRDIINEAGYQEQFGHALGHGLGLEVHEEPRVSFASDTILKAGMVITNEPGIYIPNWGGVRIEDNLVITADGCQVLNTSPKELIVI